MTKMIKAALLKIEAAILGIGVIRKRETARGTDRQEASRPDASEPTFAELGRYLGPAALFVLVIAGGVQALTLVGGNDGPQPSPDGGRKDERAHHEPLHGNEEPGKADRIMEERVGGGRNQGEQIVDEGVGGRAEDRQTTAAPETEVLPVLGGIVPQGQAAPSGPPATDDQPAVSPEERQYQGGSDQTQESDQYEPEQYEATQYEHEQYESETDENQYEARQYEHEQPVVTRGRGACRPSVLLPPLWPHLTTKSNKCIILPNSRCRALFYSNPNHLCHQGRRAAPS